jgi:HPt (histidine-containing phosphotransfer) domain-containing protein
LAQKGQYSNIPLVGILVTKSSNTCKPSASSKPDAPKKESIDWTILREVDGIDGDSNISSMELTTIYLENIGKRMNLLSTAISEKNIEKILMAAHAIKSSSSYIGAIEIKKLCNLIRTNIDVGNFEVLPSLFYDLTLEQVHVRNLLEKYYPKNGI